MTGNRIIGFNLTTSAPSTGHVLPRAWKSRPLFQLHLHAAGVQLWATSCPRRCGPTALSPAKPSSPPLLLKGIDTARWLERERIEFCAADSCNCKQGAYKKGGGKAREEEIFGTPGLERSTCTTNGLSAEAWYVPMHRIH